MSTTDKPYVMCRILTQHLCPHVGFCRKSGRADTWFFGIDLGLLRLYCAFNEVASDQG